LNVSPLWILFCRHWTPLVSLHEKPLDWSWPLPRCYSG
jgi:hypothetical protein